MLCQFRTVCCSAGRTTKFAASASKGEPQMKKLLMSATALALLLTAGASRTFALSGPAPQSAPSTQVKDTTPPSYDMKPQALLDLDGVRSIGEVFLHVAGANYFIPNLMGTPLPPGFEMKGFDKSLTEKAQIIDALNKSFASAHAAIEAMTNGDFNKPLPKLGPDANYGDVIYILV